MENITNNLTETMDMNNKSETGATKKKSRFKKVILTVSGVILTIVVALIIFVAVIAVNNTNAMNDCVDTALSEIKKHYTVTPIDAGEYEEMTIYGIMKFDVEQYNIEELGNLSIMRVNLGIMQMATVVITPKEKNAPLLSIDYMYILNNRKCYVEFYDVVAAKDDLYNSLMDKLSEVENKYAYLENLETSEAWYAHLQTVTFYKSGSSKYDGDFKKMLSDSLYTYLENTAQFPSLTEEEKAEKLNITVDYTDGLIEKGGISTDVFKNSLGDDETKKFFDKTFFGTAAN